MTKGKKHVTTPSSPIAWTPPTIVLVDHPNSGTDGADLKAIASSIQKQISYDFAPRYQADALCRYGGDGSDVQDGELVLGYFEDADQPGALGYHSVGPKGNPFAKVFPKLDKQDGANLSTTTSHEALEMLEDLLTDLAREGADGNFWADEPGDAVEQDEYTIDGQPVSNFVWPSWYSGNDTKYDQLGTCKRPLTVTPGGYAQFFKNGWHQITHADKAPRAYRMADFGRSARRRRHHALKSLAST